MATKKAPKKAAASKKTTAKKAAPKKLLKRYKEKRDFTKTPEPSGDVTKGEQGRARFFCVQKHLASHLHYDFRLEHRGVLLSWAVPKGPSLRPSDKRLAMRVEDHPFDYGEFEGVIPSGYGAGVVMLWEKGTWVPEEGFENVDAGLAKGELKFRLEGVKLKGSWVIVRAGPKTEGGERERWLLIKHRDEWAGDVDVATVAPLSVKTERDFEGILRAGTEVWESHKPGTEDLQAIVQKVVAYQEAEGKAVASTPPPKSKAKKRRS